MLLLWHVTALRPAAIKRAPPVAGRRDGIDFRHSMVSSSAKISKAKLHFERITMLFFEEPTRTRKKCPEKMKRELYKAQGGKCMYCGRKLGLDLMDCDHKNPMAKGGSDLKRNYQVLCRTCNTRKGATTDRQFRTKFKSVGVLQTQTPPAKPIPQSKFDAVAKATTTRKAKQAKTRRQREEDWWF